MTKSIKDEIIEQVDRLDSFRQRRILDFARNLTETTGTPGRNLMRFQGSIDPADLEVIAHAIQEGCATIEPNAW